MEESNVEEEEINLESDEEQDSLNKMLISQKSVNEDKILIYRI